MNLQVGGPQAGCRGPPKKMTDEAENGRRSTAQIGFRVWV